MYFPIFFPVNKRTAPESGLLESFLAPHFPVEIEGNAREDIYRSLKLFTFAYNLILNKYWPIFFFFFLK